MLRRFSAFVVEYPSHIDEVEAILISAMPPGSHEQLKAEAGTHGRINEASCEI
jgi:hypothetical protein